MRHDARKNQMLLSEAMLQEATMRPGKILAMAALGVVLAFAKPFTQISAQIYYQCPDGYYYDPTYGCLPISYYYGPPAYIYPGLGFGFFYGGNWGHGGGYARGGGGFAHGGGHPGGSGHPGGGGHACGGGHGR